MTLQATIRVQSGTDRQFEASTPQDIGELVELLAEAESDDARIEHARSPRERDDGEEVADHVLYATVRSNGFAYMRYIGPISGAGDVRDAVVPLGHPKSPEARGTNNSHYPATTGVELALFTEALHEFVATAELPTCVQWTTETQLEASDPAPLTRV